MQRITAAGTALPADSQALKALALIKESGPAPKCRPRIVGAKSTVWCKINRLVYGKGQSWSMSHWSANLAKSHKSIWSSIGAHGSQGSLIPTQKSTSEASGKYIVPVSGISLTTSWICALVRESHRRGQHPSGPSRTYPRRRRRHRQ
jgi:hypothetical protein